MKIQIILTEELTKFHKDRLRGMLKGYDKIEKTMLSCITGEGEKLLPVKKLMKETDAELIVFFGSEEGRYTGMKAAAELNYSCYTDVLDFEKGRIHKKVYSTHADGYFKFPKKKSVIILLPGGPMSEEADERVDSLIPAEYGCNNNDDNVKNIIKEVKKQDLWGIDKADLVFIGGRGLKKKENFELLVKAGEKYGAAVGCTRAAALAGWSDYSRVVGVSGSQIKPGLCILFGVSGAAPFLFGIEHAGTVIAINTDNKAPVFDVADYGIVKDCIPVVKGLIEGE